MNNQDLLEQINIYKTHDYSLFKFEESNREINPLHVTRLVRSIEKMDLTKDASIIVNEDMVILDGQHRFMAMKKLGYPIYYRIINDWDKRQMFAINQNSLAWSMKDRLRSIDNPRINEMLQAIKNTQVSARVAIILMGRTKGHFEGCENYFKELSNEEFQEGLERIDQFSELVDLYKSGSGHGHFNPWKSPIYAYAFIRLLADVHYDHDRMLEKCKFLHDKLTKKSKTEDAYRLLISIYTYRGKHLIKEIN